VLGVSKRTWIRFKQEFPEVDLALRQGQALFCVALRRRQFKAADDGNPTMLIWLGKQYLGQADKPEVTGKDGGPIQSLDLTKVSADDLETSSRSLVRLPDPATMMRLIRAEKAKRAAEEERARVAKDAERIREVARRLPASLARPGTSWSRTRRWSGTGISTRSARTSRRVTDGQRSIASSPVVGRGLLARGCPRRSTRCRRAPAGYILGFPGDTRESILRDMEIIKKELSLDIIELFIRANMACSHRQSEAGGKKGR
jgi:hypothetical protein